MANTFSHLTNRDMTATRTLLHESIPLTGSILTGTYSPAVVDNNIKNYAHGMWQSCYDYPYLSSSANHILDVTVGYATGSVLSSSTPTLQQEKKINIYQQMAQLLVGHEDSGEIKPFDRDGDLAAGGTKIKEAIFVNFARLLTKDEIKKGSFKFEVYTGSVKPGSTWLPQEDLATIEDHGAATSYKTNSPVGDYAILYTSSADINTESGVGLVYYQAGIAVLTSSIFTYKGLGPAGAQANMGPGFLSGTSQSLLTGANVQTYADCFRNKIKNISFNNTTELNSTIYFCRANHNDFNYSSNPTYLNNSKIRVKNVAQDAPVSYITTVGLYSADNELLAVAKLSEPLKKTPSNELTLRVRLDY